MSKGEKVSAWYVPGRLEVFGTHTDYAGGSSLLGAMNRGVTAAIYEPYEVRENGEIYVEPGIWVLSSAAPGSVDAAGGEALPQGHWGNYARTVVQRLTSNFGELKPARIEIDSTLPLASGMSSSSALMVGVALCLADHNSLWDHPAWLENIEDDVDLATYMSTVENGATFGSLEGSAGVGTFGGSEDHTGMIASQDGHVSHFTFCPTLHERSVPMPEGWAFVVAMSGVLAEKTGEALAAYNAASADTRKLVEIWNEHSGDGHVYLADVIAGGRNLGTLRSLAEEHGLQDRLNAFITESQVLIPAALAALEAEDLAGFGQAANLSHANARDLLKNQIPPTNFLQTSATQLGAAGATSFGAGFGGSVWAVVSEEEAPEFAAAWEEEYRTHFPEEASRASFMIARPGPAAHRL